MFFDEFNTTKKQVSIKIPPRFTDTGWRPPTGFPNLSSAAVIGFDVERRETDWDNGPGWRRGKANTCGFSLAAVDKLGNTGSWYFPIAHTVDPHFNLCPVSCKSFLKATLETPHIPKVGANLIYDVGSLTDDNIFVQGELHDVCTAEALLDSDDDVNLDHLGRKYLGYGKETNELYEWCTKAYGGKPNHLQRANIWRASPLLVGKYAEADALMPIQILQKQWAILGRDSQLDLYRMECDLIRLIVKMRLAGVTIDIPHVERLVQKLRVRIVDKYAELNHCWGKCESTNASSQIAKLFDDHNVIYPKTEKGAPSFRKDWLANVDHPLGKLINEIRMLEKLVSTFLQNYLLDKNIGGKVFCSFNPLRGDESGTKTGRFSSSDPNLQNIPVRTAEGKLIRAAFIHDAGHACFEKNDMSQQEYRELAHFAVDGGDGSAQRLRDEYCNNPATDYHDRTYDQLCPVLGIDPSDKELRKDKRRPIKNTNFGLIYGVSVKKLARMNEMQPDEAKTFFDAYFKANSYVKPTMAAAEAEMQRLGYITTILGRRIQFVLWEPARRDYDAPRPVGLPFDLAIRVYGADIKRAGGHKAINYRLQGSNADHIKKGMRDCDAAGIYNVCGVPRLQVHDELGHSVPDLSPAVNEALREMRHIVETCIPWMRVPCRVDHKRGPNWGACE